MTHGIDIEREAAIAAMVATLRVEVQSIPGARIAPDGSVKSSTAARLIDRSQKTLLNWRTAHCPLGREQKIVGKLVGGRIRYSLAEIAEWRINTGSD